MQGLWTSKTSWTPSWLRSTSRSSTKTRCCRWGRRGGGRGSEGAGEGVATLCCQACAALCKKAGKQEGKQGSKGRLALCPAASMTLALGGVHTSGAHASVRTLHPTPHLTWNGQHQHVRQQHVLQVCGNAVSRFQSQTTETLLLFPPNPDHELSSPPHTARPLAHTYHTHGQVHHTQPHPATPLHHTPATRNHPHPPTPHPPQRMRELEERGAVFAEKRLKDLKYIGGWDVCGGGEWVL